MARRCQLTGKHTVFGRNVAHSNRRTSRRFEPNVQKVTLYSDSLRRGIPLRVCARALRSVQKSGGLDAYLLSRGDGELAPEGLRLKHRVKRALRGVHKPAAPSESG